MGEIIASFMDYSEKYKTAKWQQKKCEILVRDNFTCQVCGFSSNDDADSSKLLHVHHRYYIKGKDEVWDYPNEALVTLCEDCHAKEHSCDESFIQNAIQNALNSGVLGIEIVKALNNMANKMKYHMPKNQSFSIPSKNVASRTTTTKQNTLSVQIKTSKLHKTKKELLDELAIFANQYDANYLQEFIDYWFEYTDEKRCILRCHTDENFFMPTYLAEWKNIREGIIWDKEYKRIVEETEWYAYEQYELYEEWFTSKINDEKDINASIIERNKKECEALVKADIVLLGNTLMVDVISNYKDKDVTVYEYLNKYNLPALYVEMYRYEGLDVYNDKFVNDKNRRCKNSERHLFIPYDSRKISSMYPSKTNIDAIERFFGIKTMHDIKDFNRLLHYKVCKNIYIERQKMIYLSRFNEAFIQYKKRRGRTLPIWGDANISLQEFELLYFANYQLRKNSKDIISSIKNIDENILLCDFCISEGINFGAEDKKLFLKQYLMEKIDSFDPDISFSPIHINVKSSSYIRVENNLHLQQIPVELRKGLNRKFDMNFIFYEFHFCDDNYVHCTYLGDIFESDLIPPLDVLKETDGLEFDFCAERFYKGTMKTVTIPDDAIKKDPIYYLDKVQELVSKYENTLMERKLKS